MNLVCPICGSPEFKPTSQTLNLADVLSHWQTVTGVVFSTTLWKEYVTSASAVVTLYRCSRCNFARFEPPITGSQEFYAKITAKDYYVPEKWEFLEALRDLEEFHVSRVLDVGCGSGDFLDLLRAHHFNGMGYEFSAEVAERARSRGFTIYSGDFPDEILTREGEGCLDAICMFQVLEHVAEPQELIRDARRLLHPGGLLIVAVPDAEGPLRYFPDALTDIPPHHLSRWCESVFRVGMPSLGFTVKKVAFEPLPDYLWNTYLPVLWDSNIWPAQFGRSVDPDEKMDRIDRILWFIEQMKTQGVKWLDGVPGHTLYIVLQSIQNDQFTDSINPSQLVTASTNPPSHLDPTMVRLLSDAVRYIHDWTRGQQVESKVRIERREFNLSKRESELHQRDAELGQRQSGLLQREAALNQLEASLTQRETALNQRDFEYNRRFLVRMMRLLYRIQGFVSRRRR